MMDPDGTLIGVNDRTDLSHQNESDKRHDEAERHEEDCPTMGFRSSKRFRFGAVIPAPPLAGAPQVAIHIILVHTSCAALRSFPILPLAFTEGKEKPNGILTGILSGTVY